MRNINNKILLLSFLDKSLFEEPHYNKMVELCLREQITIHNVPKEYGLMNYINQSIEKNF